MSNVFWPVNARGLFGPFSIAPQGDEEKKKEENKDPIELLKEHLQTAILLELKTIPLYLYAAYSIKASGPAKWAILNVAQQEMLHLSLAGNILCAIGGEPKLYSFDRRDSKIPSEFPSYPDTMFYQETRLNLKGATKANIRTFLNLERPRILKDIDPHLETSQSYGSIGTFYWAIGNGLKHTSRVKGEEALFIGDIAKQLQYGDGSWYNDEMVVVKDLNSALKALGIIIEQGEGNQREPQVRATGSLDPPPPFAVKSHFEIFEDLYKGPPLDCYEVFQNPKTEEFKTSDPEIYKVLLLGDAAFCYLLQTVETLWKTNDKMKRRHLINNNLHNIMLYVLRPLSTFLVSKTTPCEVIEEGEMKKKEKHFNLFFNYYPFETTGKLKELKDLTKAAVEAFSDDNILLEVKEVVDALEDVEAFSDDKVLPEVEKAVNALEDVGNQ